MRIGESCDPRDRQNKGEHEVVRSSILAASIVAIAMQSATGSAATPDEALRWLPGRWTNKGDCGIGSIEFRWTGAGWIYREAALNRGASYPATASAGPSGVATVRIPSQSYEYVNTFHDRDTFEAVEGFTGGPMQGRRMMKTYSRCK
jgi:hypothetical protein